MTKTIKFVTTNPNIFGVYEEPKPSSSMLPEWYKKQGKYSNGVKKIQSDTGTYNHTVKACMPVFDVISAGYTFTLSADVNIYKDDFGNINSSWSTELMSLVTHHPQQQYDMFSIPPEFDPVGLKFMQPWIVETPPGYSCLFVSPMYRDDLPFYSLPSIVDTDRHPAPVNFPFFLRKDFTGILESGTPIMQIIPFKREEWKSEVLLDTSGVFEKKWQQAKRKISNNYKTYFRSQKVWK
jgi:hypothetical protein